MAVVVLPEGQQRSGKQGGIVWSRNRSGAYVRNRAVPVNPNTDRQVAVRNLVRGLAIAWQTVLTQDQRDGWDLYADNVVWKGVLGQDVTLTGLNHFIRSNTPRLLCSVARVDDAPGVFNLTEAEQSLGCSASEATQQLIVTFDDTAAWCDEDDAFQVVYMGIPKNPSIKFFGGPWRQIACILGDAITPPASPAPGAGTPGWPFVAGQRIWIRTRIGRADGRVSEFARTNFLSIA